MARNRLFFFSLRLRAFARNLFGKQMLFAIAAPLESVNGYKYFHVESILVALSFLSSQRPLRLCVKLSCFIASVG